jgi:hypothetical protein
VRARDSRNTPPAEHDLVLLDEVALGLQGAAELGDFRRTLFDN